MSDDALRPGSTVGNYRIERELGGGGMGLVYAATEPTLGMRVAIKVLRAAVASDAQTVARFEREARAANQVRHPAIVEVFAFGKLDDGRPYLVMSLLEGHSLRAEIERRGKLPPADAWSIARQIADALSTAHEASVVHRDLKPDNVFLERVGDSPARVRVLDFGIAKVQSKEDLERLTNTGVPLGTPSYMGPELWWGTDVDARVDQYALGVMMFEMIAGRPPFEATGFMQLVQKHLHEPPPALDASKAIDAFVTQLLAKKPDARFASMRAVIAAGDAVFGVAPSAADPMAKTLPITPPRSVELAATVPATPKVDAPLVVPVVTSPALGRYRAVYVAVIAASLATTVVVGYAGHAAHDVAEWFHIGGWPARLLLLPFAVALVFLVRAGTARAQTGVPSTLPWWLALLPGVLGAAGTWIGWAKTTGSIDRLPTTLRFAVLNEGMFEASATRFIGLSLSLVLLLALSAVPALSGGTTSATLTSGLGVRLRESVAFLVGFVALALAAVMARAPSGLLIATTGAIGIAVGIALPALHPRTAARDELERALASTLAMVVAITIAFARIDARQAALWDEQGTRAARVNEIVAAAAERRATMAIAIAGIVGVLLLETIRLRRLWSRAQVERPKKPVFVLIFVVFSVAAFDVVQHDRIADARLALWRVLEKPFALFARLDPPSAAGLDAKSFAPHQAPTLQLTRDVVALDAEPIAPLAALSSPEGPINLSGAIGRAIAAQATTATGAEPSDRDLALAIDGEVPWRTVALVLGIAQRSGARRIELRFTRGPRPEIPASAPPESGYVLPSDFVAVPIELADVGSSAAPDAPFRDVAPTIIGRAGGTPVAIAIPR